jgi:hypothetical protein
MVISRDSVWDESALPQNPEDAVRDDDLNKIKVCYDDWSIYK